jgi:hypothetical protein
MLVDAGEREGSCDELRGVLAIDVCETDDDEVESGWGVSFLVCDCTSNGQGMVERLQSLNS